MALSSAGNIQANGCQLRQQLTHMFTNDLHRVYQDRSSISVNVLFDKDSIKHESEIPVQRVIAYKETQEIFRNHEFDVINFDGRKTISNS